MGAFLFCPDFRPNHTEAVERKIPAELTSYQKRCNMIDNKAHNPGYRHLERRRSQHPPPAAGLLFNGGEGSRAGDVQQREGHKGQGVGGTEAHAAEYSGEGGHAGGGVYVVDAEEHRAA